MGRWPVEAGDPRGFGASSNRGAGSSGYPHGAYPPPVDVLSRYARARVGDRGRSTVPLIGGIVVVLLG
jgi:hypothetical protein